MSIRNDYLLDMIARYVERMMSLKDEDELF